MQDLMVLSKFNCLFNGTNENKKNEKTRILKNFKKKWDKPRHHPFKLRNNEFKLLTPRRLFYIFNQNNPAMEPKNKPLKLGIFLYLSFCCALSAQIQPNVYHFEENNKGDILTHELKIDSDYFVHSTYKKSPPEFIRTYGGYYTVADNQINVTFEFNSDYKNDNKKSLRIPFQIQQNTLILDLGSKMAFKPTPRGIGVLDGKWLFGGRVTDQGEERVDNSDKPRKTLKFLLNGHFQWIAFNTETMEFVGTGGGTYDTGNGKYTESIAYFSRDNSRVGASLTFNFELRDNNDWYQNGKSSKGDPIHEIWARRK